MKQDEFSVQGAGWSHLCSLFSGGNLRRAPIGDGDAKVLRGAQKGCQAELLSQVSREPLT